MTIAGQTAVSYTFDNANRLTGIARGAASTTIAYNDASRRTSLTLPNGIVVEYGYDDDSRVTGLTYKLGGSTVGALTYAYDATGRRTTVGGSYARTTLPSAVASATYDDANQIATFGGTSFTYDDNGNLTDDGSRSFVWNKRNQLESLSGPVNGAFAYDGAGRRRAKTIGGTTTQFLYDGLNPVQELASGTPTANLLTGLMIDEFFTRTDAAGVRGYLVDALGSSVALADGSGAIQTEYTYEPFGSTTASGSSTTSTYAFTGREVDGTGLLYFRKRFYHPEIQRFVREDPIGFRGQTPNLHAYVLNAPTMNIDPLGLSPSRGRGPNPGGGPGDPGQPGGNPGDPGADPSSDPPPPEPDPMKCGTTLGQAGISTSASAPQPIWDRVGPVVMGMAGQFVQRFTGGGAVYSFGTAALDAGPGATNAAVAALQHRNQLADACAISGACGIPDAPPPGCFK